jgi:hypothetical protein
MHDWLDSIEKLYSSLLHRFYIQAKHCYYKYNEFFRCEKFKGEGHEQCKSLKHDFLVLCPVEWVSETYQHG